MNDTAQVKEIAQKDHISLYTTNWCPFCVRAKQLLESLGYTWQEINIEREGISRADLGKLTGGYTVPQIIINDEPIGGFTELYALYQQGQLPPIKAA